MKVVRCSRESSETRTPGPFFFLFSVHWVRASRKLVEEIRRRKERARIGLFVSIPGYVGVYCISDQSMEGCM